MCVGIDFVIVEPCIEKEKIKVARKGGGHLQNLLSSIWAEDFDSCVVPEDESKKSVIAGKIMKRI